MHTNKKRWLFLACLPLVTNTWAQDAESPQASRVQLIPEITVVGSIVRDETIDITPGASAAPIPDAMEILTRMPGANVNRNGPLTGQAQYRGLFGPRMTVTVNDMRVTPGGPNWMDPPLHYMPAGLTRNVIMTRGIASVSEGPGIGGLIQAESKQSSFTSDHEFAPQGDVIGSYMSNDGYSIAGLAGAANVNHRFHLIGAYEDGDDTEFGGGTIGATEYERATYGVGYGFRWGYNELSIEYSHTDTDPTGTPALPLDIDFFDTDRLNLGFNSTVSDVDLTFRVFYTDIEHAMNNYLLRNPPDFSQAPLPPFADEDRRFVAAETDALGFVFNAGFDAFGGNLVLGVDGNFESHDVEVTDPDFAPFFVINYNDATTDYVGVFAEWLGELTDNWSLEAGVRYARVETDADEVDSFPSVMGEMPGALPPLQAATALRDRFNAADRSVTDNNVDLVLKLNYEIDEDLLLGFGYARKTRSPMYLERYSWIPLEVNAGLGDLNNYVGDINLDPEVSDQIEASLDWVFERGYLSPRIFYRWVDDYIQGVASTDMDVIMVSTVNGDPTPLEFSNVEAKLYGLDVVGRYKFADQWTVDATLNYVRGKRDDIDDDLYRIAPLNGRLALTYEQTQWSVTVENVLVAEQDKISRTIVLDEVRSNNEATSGYGIVNLYGEWRSGNGFQVRAGVENIFDKDYTLHVAGFNRVTNSDVAFGDRLPGSGVNIFGQVSYAW